jgi:hypothetical protein
MSLLESASYEILVLFSTINSFSRADYSGILNSLWQASQRGVTISSKVEPNTSNHIAITKKKAKNPKFVVLHSYAIPKGDPY